VRSIHRNAWLLVALSAALQILIFPLPNLFMLSWVAVAPLLVALLRARVPNTLQLPDAPKLLPATPLQGFVLGYACGILWYAGSCYWIYSVMRHYGGVETFAACGILILFCLYLALYHGAFGLIVSLLAHGESRRRALVFAPLAWVAVELARTRITGFPWDLLGIAQVDNIPLSQIAAITGVYGLSFEIMLVNTAFAAAFVVRRQNRKQLMLAALAASVVLQSGLWVPGPTLAPDHTAFLLQANIPILESSDWTKDYYDTTLQQLTVASLRPNAPSGVHADLIVWPESPAPFYTGDPVFRQAISDITRQAQAWAVAGSIGVNNATPGHATEVYNSAALVGPAGDWVARYDKIHLVPFGEYVPFEKIFAFAGGLTKEVGDFTAGASRAPLDAGGTKLGTFICYESIFPGEIRQLAANGAEVLVNVSNDGWYGDSGAYAQHLRQARMRAVENDRWLLRDTNTGVTASIDPYGRVVASVPRKLRTTLVAPYALNNVTTFYTRHGDWFAYLCAIISMAALIARIRIHPRTQQ
jgi:apolipoprotein N-acyltransferase